MESSTVVEGEVRMMPIRLTTTVAKHSIPDAQYMVPSNWKRFQLSELINKVLENDVPVPFDFVVDEKLLRTSLIEFAKSKGLTEETVLEIEYIESVLPPKFISSIPHEDWISDLDMSHAGSFLTSSYTTNITIFTGTPKPQHTFQGHTQPALSACWIGPALPSSSTSQLIASGGMDRIIRVWSVNADGNSDAPPVYHLPLHSEPVSSVRSSPKVSKPSLISAGWDGLVAFWTLDDDLLSDGKAEEGTEENQRSKKKRKTNDASVPKLAPVHVLHGHTGLVSRAIFDKTDPKKAYSAGWDHSIRMWDLETGVMKSQRTSDKVLLALDQMASTNLLVTGATDRSVAFWDERQETNTISLTLHGHTSHVTAVKAHPDSPLLVVSGSLDATVKIWDARSPKQALFNVDRTKTKKVKGTGKVLCLDWDGQVIGIGGDSNHLELHKANINTLQSSTQTKST